MSVLLVAVLHQPCVSIKITTSQPRGVEQSSSPSFRVFLEVFGLMTPIIVWTHLRIQPHGPDFRKAGLERSGSAVGSRVAAFMQKKSGEWRAPTLNPKVLGNSRGQEIESLERSGHN